MKIGVVIPWREQPTRVDAFNAVKKWYEVNFPDAKIYLPDHPGPVWLPSATRNDGVRMAQSDGVDIIIMNDADTIPEIIPLNKAINAASKDNLIHIPYTRYHILTKIGTAQFYKGIAINRCQGKLYRDACSGTNVFTPKAWWDIGGMDEEFKKWGYEDTAMQVAHKVIHGLGYIKHEGSVYSIYHEPQDRSGEIFDNNKQRFELYQNAKTPEDIWSILNNTSINKNIEKINNEILEPIKKIDLIENNNVDVKLNILAIASIYLPKNNAGAEIMMHNILKDLQNRGHSVTVASQQTITSYDNIYHVNLKDTTMLNKAIIKSDIVITHLGGTKYAIKYSARFNKPIVHLIHNDRQAKLNKLNKRNAKLFVANSEWIKDSLSNFNIKTIVVNPPVNPEQYFVKRGNAITLINLTAEKGGDIFWQLARIFPKKEFIGVKGGYGTQVIPSEIPSNVKIIDNSPDIKKVYKQTGILIMPSSYESWGRVAVEAMSSGIPVIANKTNGLAESLQDAGIFVTQNDVASFVEEIRKLDDKKIYNAASEAGLERSKNLHEQYLTQFDIFENELKRLAGKK